MERQLDTIRKKFDAAISICFIAAIALPGLGTFFGWGHTVQLNENRRLAIRPSLPTNFAELHRYWKRLQPFLRDDFGFRGNLIAFDSLLKLQLNVSSNQEVLIGRKGWLFFTGGGSVASYLRTRPFNRDQLNKWVSILERRAAAAERFGGKYVFFMAPDKQTIYPEFMPRDLKPVRRISRLDQLASRLRQNPTLIFVDPRAAILRAKRSERVYHLTDSHWNDRGAYAAYHAVITAASTAFPRLRPQERSDFRELIDIIPGKDLSAMLGLEWYMQETDLKLEPQFGGTWTGDSQTGVETRNAPIGDSTSGDLLKIVFFGDSFGVAIAPLFKEHSSRWLYVNSPFDAAIVERERPDLVIEELAERKLMQRRYLVDSLKPIAIDEEDGDDADGIDRE